MSRFYIEAHVLSLCFGRCGRSRRVFCFLGRAAIEAHKHGRSQDTLERAVVSGLVYTAFDAAHGVAGAAEAFKR